MFVYPEFVRFLNAAKIRKNECQFEIPNNKHEITKIKYQITNKFQMSIFENSMNEHWNLFVIWFCDLRLMEITFV